MQIIADAGWCWLMLVDTDWYWLMLIDADWYWLMLIDREIGEVSKPADFPQDDHQPHPPQDPEKWVLSRILWKCILECSTFKLSILLIGSNIFYCRVSPISATAVAAASFKKRSPRSPGPGKGSKEERDKGTGNSPVAGKSPPSPKISLCAPDSLTNLTAQRTLFRQYILSCYDFGSFQSICFCSEDFSDLVEEGAGELLDRPSSQPTRWWAYSVSLLSPSYNRC